MTKIKKMLVLPAVALALAATQANAIGVAKRTAPAAPSDSYQGQWYTTPDGCSYSRAKAPGYATMWVLIRNPYHIGQPPAGRHCATLLKAQR
jgi:hypothetical protein